MTRAFSVIFASIFLILSSAAPVAAGPFEDAREAHYKRDYATVIRLLRPLADQGNARAETILGSMYEYGEGVPKDYSEARIWLKKAADQGSSEAQFQLGFTYVNPVVAYNLGAAKNYNEAGIWFRKAADQGHVLAQFYLGLMYRDGEGVPQDYVLAHMWYNLSAAQGNQSAAKERDVVGSLMTPAQIAEAQKLARDRNKERTNPCSDCAE
jgi:TPR repeat protein